MHRLNDDCLLEIFKYLQLKEEIALLQSCKHFKDLLKECWQKKYKKLDKAFFDYTKELKTEEFKLLLANICDNVEIVIVGHNAAEQFKILMEHEFPKTYELSFGDELIPYYVVEDDILRLIEIFPNLHTFYPEGFCSGKHFIDWQHLECLSLRSCFEFKHEFLMEILKVLNLKRLEVGKFVDDLEMLDAESLKKLCLLQTLALNTNELKWLLKAGLQNFENLEELSLFDTENEQNRAELYMQIRQHKSKAVIALYMTDLYPLTFKCNYENLVKISITDYWISFSEILVYYEFLPKLCNLILDGCYMRNQADVLHFLQMSPQLDELTIQDCNSDFPKLILNILELVKQRTKRLLLNINSNRYGEFIDGNLEYFDLQLELQGHSDLIQIKSEPIKSLLVNADTIIFQ